VQYHSPAAQIYESAAKIGCLRAFRQLRWSDPESLFHPVDYFSLFQHKCMIYFSSAQKPV